MNIFNVIWIAWFASEVLLNRFMRSASEDKKHQDKGSILFIWLVIAVAITSGIMITNYMNLPVSNQLLLRYAGLFIIILGMIFRFFSIWTLGRFFTVDVTIRDNHKLKKDGIYKTIRHPSYSGSLLSFVGFGISLNNWISLIVITVLVTYAFLRRIKIEEKALSEHFGAEYLDYKENTYRLIPYLY